MLSPVLLLGPSTVALSKPVVMTFRHCASVRHGQWILSLIGSDSAHDESLHWQVLYVLRVLEDLCFRFVVTCRAASV